MDAGALTLCTLEEGDDAGTKGSGPGTDVGTLGDATESAVDEDGEADKDEGEGEYATTNEGDGNTTADDGDTARGEGVAVDAFETFVRGDGDVEASSATLLGEVSITVPFSPA